jgi:hypothetical protein
VVKNIKKDKNDDVKEKILGAFKKNIKKQKDFKSLVELLFSKRI